MPKENPRETFLQKHGMTALLAALLAGFVAAMQFGAFDRPHPLLGKSAPEFTLKTLNEETVTLANHLGKEVVVLDFFATWCPPCRASLPHFAALSTELEGKPVAVYAVNVGESAAVVEDYFKQNGLQINVLMDETGAAAEGYGVSGIPQQVVIGKDGLIQYVNSGFGLGDETALRGAVETLLDGGTLVPPRLGRNPS